MGATGVSHEPHARRGESRGRDGLFLRGTTVGIHGQALQGLWAERCRRTTAWRIAERRHLLGFAQRDRRRAFLQRESIESRFSPRGPASRIFFRAHASRRGGLAGTYVFWVFADSSG